MWEWHRLPLNTKLCSQQTHVQYIIKTVLGNSVCVLWTFRESVTAAIGSLYSSTSFTNCHHVISVYQWLQGWRRTWRRKEGSETLICTSARLMFTHRAHGVSITSHYVTLKAWNWDWLSLVCNRMKQFTVCVPSFVNDLTRTLGGLRRCLMLSSLLCGLHLRHIYTQFNFSFFRLCSDIKL